MSRAEFRFGRFVIDKCASSPGGSESFNLPLAANLGANAGARYLGTRTLKASLLRRAPVVTVNVAVEVG